MLENPELRSLTGEAGVDGDATAGLLIIVVVFLAFGGNGNERCLRSFESGDSELRRRH